MFQVVSLTNECKSAGSLNQFCNAIFTLLISNETSQDLQWKATERGEDRRQGISNLVHVIAVIGGITLYFDFNQLTRPSINFISFLVGLNCFARSRSQSTTVKAIVELIKNARKQAASLHRTAVGMTKEDALQRSKNATPIIPSKVTDREVFSNVDQAISNLEKAVASFKLPT